jgi:hypothetical protein
MEKHEMELEISKNNMFPSSIPHADFFSGALTQNNRGHLLFKNYESKNLGGSASLNSWTWSPPSSQIYAYTEGSKIGPYVAAAGSHSLGDLIEEIMVMDYEMSSNQDWVGAQMNLSTGWDDALDLSNIAAIRFAYRVAELPAGEKVSLHFQAGALDEDLDADGRLDEEAGPSSRGYAFNHGVLTLYVGGGQEGFGNDIRDSEDAN